MVSLAGKGTQQRFGSTESNDLSLPCDYEVLVSLGHPNNCLAKSWIFVADTNS